MSSNSLLPDSQPYHDIKGQPRYYTDRQGEMDDTAYEPYSHRGSNHDRLVQPRTAPLRRNLSSAGKRGPRRACVFFSTVSTIISLGIVGVSTDIVVILGQTKTARLLWDYNMMMQAWPLTGAPAVPTYVTISAASATALLNVILLFSVLCGVSQKNDQWSLSSSQHAYEGSSEMVSILLVSRVHLPWEPICSWPHGLLQHW